MTLIVLALGIWIGYVIGEARGNSSDKVLLASYRRGEKFWQTMYEAEHNEWEPERLSEVLELQKMMEGDRDA